MASFFTCNASLITAFPPEIRNQIYSHILFSDSPTHTINITPTGKFLVPALTLTSRQIHAEVTSYITSALHHPTTRFEAKVRDYDPRPLVATLKRIAQETGFHLGDLICRCTFHFIKPKNEYLHLDNVVTWVERSSFSRSKAVQEVQSVFSGIVPLTFIWNSYREFEKRGEVIQWEELAGMFLLHLDARGVSVAAVEDEVREAVVKNYVEWHDRFLDKVEENEGDCRYVVQAMMIFAMDLESAMEAWPVV